MSVVNASNQKGLSDNAVAMVGDSQNATPSSGRTAHVLMVGIDMHF